MTTIVLYKLAQLYKFPFYSDMKESGWASLYSTIVVIWGQRYS